MSRTEALDFSGALFPLLVVLVPFIDALSQVKATPVMTGFASNPRRRGLTDHDIRPLLSFTHPAGVQRVLLRESRIMFRPPEAQCSQPTDHASRYNVLLGRSSVQLSLPPPSPADPVQQIIPRKASIPEVSFLRI